ncbi:MarR family transcriptional regulator [Rhodophyticola sp. CCM32]|uniref:MarR family winged helix-turn-helix transcriptional regulator n=1 Tax=Rhodophyticola sp. CCM32 TaxID=2916397 RepID=UPI00107F5769|nr:MarR family winged helix-turn-helix transcriptional regulator [Rhodophyticola sp. CCM32]QBY01946.1 MarR family transcriptional regulator [Rhodophyticola sp. CCM32]
MTTPFTLDMFLPYRVSVLAGQLSRDYARIYRERFGLNRAEWRVVAHLSQETAVSVREIHARVDMDKSKVSRAATRLEEAGYVTKRTNATDRRLVELALTEKGHGMMAELAPLAQAFQAELLASLGAEAGGFLAGIDKLSGDRSSID